MKTTVTVTIDIECEYSTDALYVVNQVLNNGDFQDAIADYAESAGPVLTITSILAE